MLAVFIAASALLNISMPTLSRTVKRVEQIVGVLLFERQSGHIVITSAGREFVAVAERVVNDLEISLRNMAELGTEQRGRVILSATPVFTQDKLPAILLGS